MAPELAAYNDSEGSAEMLTDDIDRSSGKGRYNIAVLAPPWEPVTSESHDLECAISLLCGGLVQRGHRVTLFAAPGTTCSATVHEIVQPHRVHDVGAATFETDYVARVLGTFRQRAQQRRAFDIVHDHCGFPVIALADWIPVPVVHTMHWSFHPKLGEIYAHYADSAHLVATSQAQVATMPPDMPIAGIVPDPIDLEAWPLQPTKQNYIVWSWRFEPLHGAREVISAVRAAKVPLVLSGPVGRGQERWFGAEIAPFLDNDQVRYLGEVDDNRRRQLISDARGLLLPTAAEVYRTDIVHALAAGTPVITAEGGVAAEIIEPGVNGYVASGEEALAAAVADLDTLDPRDCRETAVKSHGVEVAVARYEMIYHRIVGHRERRRAQVAARGSRSRPLSAVHHRRPRRQRIGL